MKKPAKSTARTLAPDRYWNCTTLNERKAKIVIQASPHQQALAQLQAQLDQLQPQIEAAQKAAGLDPKGAYAFNDADLTATLQETAPQ